MKTLRPITLLVLGLIVSCSASSAGETKTTPISENENGIGLSVSAEFSSSGSTDWTPANPGQAKVGTTEQTYTFSQSLITKPEETLIASIDFHQTDFDFDRGAFQPLLPEGLVSTAATALYKRKLTTTWTVGALGQVGRYTAGRKGEWSGGGWSTAFGLIAQYQVNPVFSFKIGAVYRTLAEGNEHLLPTIGFAWQINEACRFTVGFPRTAFTYQVTDRIRVGMVATGNSDTYRVKHEPTSAALAGVALRDQRLSYTEIAACLEIEYECTSHLTLRAALGQVLQREVEYRSRGRKLETRKGPPIGTLAFELAL